jgi:hypothetical protein
MRGSSSTSSHPRRPAVSGGGGRRFGDGARLVECMRCTSWPLVSFMGSWGSTKSWKKGPDVTPCFPERIKP